MKVIGGIVIGAGILIAGASGLCSLVLLADPMNRTGPSAGESLTIIALVGGIPFLAGTGLILFGRHLFRQGKES